MIHVYHVLSEMARKKLLILENFRNSARSPTLSLPGLRRASKSSQRKASPWSQKHSRWPLLDHRENQTEKCSPFENQKKKTFQAEEDALASSEQ